MIDLRNKTVSLVYGYSAKNAGDFAITLGALDVLIGLNCTVKLFSRYFFSDPEFIESKKYIENRYGDQIEVFSCPFNLDRSSSFIRTVKSYLEGAMIVSGLKKAQEFRTKLLESDYVIFNGGNLFRCKNFIDYTRLKALMYPLEIARKAKHPIVIFPQSASGINALGRQLLKPIIEKSDAIYYREAQSQQYCNSLFHNECIFITTDLAFHINQDIEKPTELSSELPTIAITLRMYSVGDIKLFNETEKHKIFDSFIELYNRLNQHAKFKIVVQTKKDAEYSYELSKLLDNIEVVECYDPIKLLNIYRSCALLIGMRLHSIILALSSGTPCLGLFYKEWGLKNPGMLEEYGLPYYFMDGDIDIEHITDLAKDVLSNTAIRQLILEKVNNKRSEFLNTFA